MQEVILLKLGEIVLKGLNRRSFEDMLVKTVRRRLRQAGEFDVRAQQSTIYVAPKDEQADLDLAEEIVSKIFGIVSYSRAGVCEKNIADIQRRAAEYLQDTLSAISSFKVESKRSDKHFPHTSPEISNLVGGYLLSQFPNLTVNVRRPDTVVRVEVREENAFVHVNAREGAGGIPVGTGGRAAILISGGLDSPVAAWMLAKRGVELTAVHFASPPYTSELAHKKVENLLKKVSEYAGRIRMVSVSFTRLQEEIRDKCPEELNTVILRRYMLKASERIARENHCEALITGESLGQVASQTMQAIACTDAAVTMPVFRPLIGSDKSEIVKVAYKIGTYDISIAPYEDCCTIFTPKHPKTRPNTYRVEAAEKSIDPALLEEAISGAKVIEIVP